MKILRTNIRHDLNEEEQTISLKFAFCDHTVEEDQLIFFNLHPLVKCRDFLNDFLYCLDTDKSFSLYGFTIEKGYKKTKDLLMNLLFPDYKTLEIFINNFEFYMCKYDALADNKLTKIIYTKDLDMILEVDNNWFLTSQSISAFTLLLRLFCNKVIVQRESIIEDIFNSDYDLYNHTDLDQMDNYGDNFNNHLNQFIRNYKKLYQIQPHKNYLNVDTPAYIHGYSGIYTFLNHIHKNPPYLTFLFFEETHSIYKQLINHE